MIESVEEYAGTLAELLVALVVIQFLISTFVVAPGETSIFKQIVEAFITSVAG